MTDNLRWFVHQRMEWIAETLRIFGFIRREHLRLRATRQTAIFKTRAAMVVLRLDHRDRGMKTLEIILGGMKESGK